MGMTWTLSVACLAGSLYWRYIEPLPAFGWEEGWLMLKDCCEDGCDCICGGCMLL